MHFNGEKMGGWSGRKEKEENMGVSEGTAKLQTGKLRIKKNLLR